MSLLGKNESIKATQFLLKFVGNHSHKQISDPGRRNCSNSMDHRTKMVEII